MKLTEAIVKPHLARLKSLEITQTALAAELGVTQGHLSAFMLRKGLLDEVRVGRGGIRPISDAMASAQHEALTTSTPMTVLARRYNVSYISLAKRVQRRRDAAAAKEAAEAPARANDATVRVLEAALGITA